MREGWVWDHDTGDKREATSEEMEKAVRGEMEIDDPTERKFAAQAARVKLESAVPVSKEEASAEVAQSGGAEPQRWSPSPLVDQLIEAIQPDVSDASENIVVAPHSATPTRRSVRRATLRSSDGG